MKTDLNIPEQTLQEFEQYKNLPLPVYLVSKEGRFLKYNKAAQVFFDLPETPSPLDNITNFYNNQKDRDSFIKKLTEMPDGEWLRNNLLDLSIKGEKRFVRDFSKVIHNPTNNNLVALLCTAVELTEEERYHKLFKELPVGIFKFNNSGKLEFANPKFLEMHGYQYLEEVKGKTIDFFVEEKEEAKSLLKKIIDDGEIIKERVEHRRKDSSTFTASINAVALREDSNCKGCEGTITDVTIEEIYSKLINEVPIGLYKVRINSKGEHIIVHCNQYFAEICGASDKNELIRKDIRNYHGSKEKFEKFVTALNKAEQKGEHSVDHIIEAYDKRGKLRKYQVRAKLLKDKYDRTIGRVGAEKDVTDFYLLKERLDRLTLDIGKVLHAYTSTLVNSTQTMQAVIRSHSIEEQALNGKIANHQLTERLNHRITILETAIEKLLTSNEELKQIPENVNNKIRFYLELLKKEQKQEFSLQSTGIIRDVAIHLVKILNKHAKTKFPRELTKNIRRNLSELLRYASLLTLEQGVNVAVDMSVEVNHLRDYIMSGHKVSGEKEAVDLVGLVYGIVKNLDEYAVRREVEVRITPRYGRKIWIEAYERDFTRALFNVIHNAIKYSWKRTNRNIVTKRERAWIAIDISKTRTTTIIKVENWGVGITKKEVKNNYVFQFGYRGVLSSDKKRPGTGIGLADAKEVIEQHNGTISITSEPTKGERVAPNKQPYLTIVTIQLPNIISLPT